jgi:hypothetical protein
MFKPIFLLRTEGSGRNGFEFEPCVRFEHRRYLSGCFHTVVVSFFWRPIGPVSFQQKTRDWLAIAGFLENQLLLLENSSHDAGADVPDGHASRYRQAALANCKCRLVHIGPRTIDNRFACLSRAARRITDQQSGPADGRVDLFTLTEVPYNDSKASFPTHV